MKKSVDVSIVIVSYNTRELLDRCLTSLYKSLKSSRLTVEVWVVDNVSRDGTLEMLSQKFPRVTVIKNSENVGFGRANNQAIDRSTGEYILLLNSDTEVLGAAIDKLTAFARQHPKTFVGGKLYNVDRSPQPSCGPFLTLPVVFAMLFLKGDKIGLTRYSPEKPRRVDWISGACIMAGKTTFLDGLLFDMDIFMYMEEIDLLYRSRLKGYQTYFCPEAEFIHVGSGSSTGGKKQPVLNIYRGLVYFYRRHYRPTDRIILTFLLKLKALVSIVIAIMLGKPNIREMYAEAYHLV